ncbi:hypothetical protein MMSP_3978 [Mycobacterium sp. 012931]|nr:hypothetical protein MMSP_3978 [Mycobacterium sp. 012931]MBC9865899.1 hypothetical protein [Mycobacterium pseudoshottsii]
MDSGKHGARLPRTVAERRRVRWQAGWDSGGAQTQIDPGRQRLQKLQQQRAPSVLDPKT